MEPGEHFDNDNEILSFYNKNNTVFSVYFIVYLLLASLTSFFLVLVSWK